MKPYTFDRFPEEVGVPVWVCHIRGPLSLHGVFKKIVIVIIVIVIIDRKSLSISTV
jgi:hypothetical protein